MAIFSTNAFICKNINVAGYSLDAIKQNAKHPTSSYLAVTLSALLLLIPCITSTANAEFTLGFTPQSGGTYFITDSLHEGTGGGNTTGQTRYAVNDGPGPLDLPEIVNIGGVDYYHMILGDINDGFIQETYIEIDTVVDHGENKPDGLAWNLNGTASGGTNLTYEYSGVCCGPQALTDAANGTHVLRSDAGNGSANPNKVVIRQYMTDGEIITDFIKDSLWGKPKTTMMITTPGITMMFDADMRSIDYNTINVAAPVTNLMWLNGADVPSESASFDMSQDSSADQSVVTAGKFIYQAPETPLVGYGGDSGGSYTYETGSFDVNAVNWEAFFDHTPGVNPWGYESGKPTP